LSRRFGKDQLNIRFYLKLKSEHFLSLLTGNQDLFWADKKVRFIESFDNNYYKTIQFKIFLKRGDQEMDLADGGVTDWTQKLLGNKKHRLFISGLGLDLMEKM
jgi:hypothetical protein